MKRKTIAVFLVAVLLVSACNASVVQAYINLAVGIALQVAKLAGLPLSAANQVAADLATVNKLIADYRTADATAKPGKLAEIDTYLNIAQADLSAILAAAHVSDPKLQATIQASIGIAITAVESIRQLENSQQHSAAAKTVKVATAAAITVIPGGGAVPKGKTLTPAQLKEAYNKAVADYPQAQLH